MTDYPSIKPEDVREGDVVRGTREFLNHLSTVEGEAWREGFGSLFVAGTSVALMTDLRLVSRTDWRVGDRFTRAKWGDAVYRMTTVTADRWEAVVEDAPGGMAAGASGPSIGTGAFAGFVPVVHRPAPPEPALRVGDFVRWASGIESQVQSHDLGFRHHATRIEPPVGWPVGVPTEDGGTRWYVRWRGTETRYYNPAADTLTDWADLLAAGGVPALAVTA